MLPPADPASVGLDPERIERLYGVIGEHIAEGQYPGAQVAFARHGKLAAFRTFGSSRLHPKWVAGTDETPWLMYSQTKVVVAAAIWLLAEQGALNFDDTVAAHVPEFAQKSKGAITIFQILTLQAGFPSAGVSREAWADHERLRREVCNFELEWWPGCNIQYHGSAAAWVAAVLVEAITGRDYREFIRAEVLDPLGITDIKVGVPLELHGRCSDMHVRQSGKRVPAADPIQFGGPDPSNTSEWRVAGMPPGGGYGTAGGIAAFFQMILAGGTLNGVRLFGPRLIQYVTRNHTGGRVDLRTGEPMNLGAGPHVRAAISQTHNTGLGTIASAPTFGHHGAGSSYSWGDPETGLSFTYLTNCRSDEPWHSRRMDRVSNLAHAALVEV